MEPRPGGVRFSVSFADGENLLLEIYQYPTDERDAAERELGLLAYGHGRRCRLQSFAETFDQLYADRDTDEFEFNWRQPFPYRRV